MSDSTGTPRDVLAWLKQHGGSYDEEIFGLEQFEEMGWGGVALKVIEASINDPADPPSLSDGSLQPDTTLFTIPDDLLMSISHGRLAPLFESTSDDYLVRAWEELGGPSGGWPALILTLMYEHNAPGSKWETYIRHMPEVFNTPMFWSEAELEELKGTDVPGESKELHLKGRTSTLPARQTRLAKLRLRKTTTPRLPRSCKNSPCLSPHFDKRAPHPHVQPSRSRTTTAKHPVSSPARSP